MVVFDSYVQLLEGMIEVLLSIIVEYYVLETIRTLF